MNRFVRNLVLRSMIALMVWTPCQLATAAMVGTDAAAVSTVDRAALVQLVNRPDVSSRLQAFGVAPDQARERINAMTDEEVRALDQRLESLPAGQSNHFGALVAIILIAAAIWWVVRNR